MAGVSAMAVCSWKGVASASQILQEGKSLASGRPIRVFLAGVGRGASEQVMKLAVRAAAEATTDFSPLPSPSPLGGEGGMRGFSSS